MTIVVLGLVAVVLIVYSTRVGQRNWRRLTSIKSLKARASANGAYGITPL